MVAAMRRAPAPSLAWCLFLDVDGTLLDIADTPAGVVVDEALKDLLSRVSERLGGAVALVSGRSIAALDELFAPLKLPAAGQHGAERRSAAGLVSSAADDGSRLALVRAHLAAFVESNPGTLLEDKGRSLAVHFRLAPGLGDMVRRAVTEEASRVAPRYEVQEGKMVFEIKPRGFTKASAAEAFMREAPFAMRTPVFVGDDLTDESGLRFAEAAGGLAVAVGTRVRADWQLDDPKAVRRWLTAIAALGAHPARGR